MNNVIGSARTFSKSYIDGPRNYKENMSELAIATAPADEPLQWRHNGHHGVSYHQPHHCLHNRLFRHRWKKTSKLRVTGLCVGNSPVTGEFPAQMAGNAENVSIWWSHHGIPVGVSFVSITTCWLRGNCNDQPIMLRRPWYASTGLCHHESYRCRGAK